MDFQSRQARHGGPNKPRTGGVNSVLAVTSEGPVEVGPPGPRRRPATDGRSPAGLLGQRKVDWPCRRREPLEISTRMGEVRLEGRWQVSRTTRINAGMGAVPLT